ncbi:MAG: hypothetical protein Q8Q10_00245 [bacterium]|nr:hypothetical protein [bacterium]
MAKKTLKIEPVKQENTLSSVADLRLSSSACFSVFLGLSLLIAGLLYTASYRVSHMAIVSPVATNPNARLERNVRKVVTGYPIEEMIPYIAEHKKVTAAFLVGIAKKESNWGKRVPRSEDGADCFNYWGYRGAGSRGMAMGHGCFGSREEAIAVVSKRIDTLVNEYHFDTPEELIVWKCGWNCDGHSPTSVRKWISDVKIYFNKVNKT